MPFVHTIIRRHGRGSTRRVMRVRGTYSIATSVRVATVGILHPNVGRFRMMTTVRTITTTTNYRLSFTAVTAVGKRALRGRCRNGAMGSKSLFLVSTKTRARVKCTKSVSSAVPTSGGFAAHRHRICRVRGTVRLRSIGTLHPNVPCVSICSLSTHIVMRNLGKLNLVGNGTSSTMHRKTRTLFCPRKLKRVVKLSMRSVRGLNRL